MSNSSIAAPAAPEEKDALILKQQEQISTLTVELNNLKRILFGKKSERFVPAAASSEQTSIFNEEKPAVGFAETKEKITYERRKPAAKGHGRNPIPAGIYTEVITLEPSEEEKRCACCGSDKVVIGNDETTELEYKPAVFFAKKYVRPKYVCRKCPDTGVTTAKLPARPIERGVAGLGLIVWIIISKYKDGLPLYRIEKIFKRYGIHINRSSMMGWIEQVCKYLQNIVDTMHKQLLGCHYCQADETPIKVLEGAEKGKSHLGFLWPYVGDGKIAVFNYREGRDRGGPNKMLTGFTGKYLMSDGYVAYENLAGLEHLIRLICWAHARRKFFEAKDNEPELAKTFLTLIGKLYDVERKAKENKLKPEELFELRKKESAPILEEIHALLKNPGKTILPQNPMGKAIAYALNHWTELNNFMLDGNLPIDNNLVERLIRTVAIARKNFLFCGSHEGAKRTAVIYSLLATCELNNIEPFEYFTDVLGRIADHPQKKIHELTPIAWKMSKNPA
jgi:transposase